MPRQTLKQRSDGRYACKYKGRFFYGATQSEALAAREAYKRSEENHVRNDKITLRQYATEWLPIHKASVGKKTYNDYAVQLDKMCSVIGHKYIGDVTPSDVKSVFSQYVGFSESTIHRANMIFKSVFESAAEDGYISKNPCKSKTAAPHKGTVGTHRTITAEERSLILSTPHRVQLAAITMLYTGIRRGEALAIQLERDVDLTSNTLTVREAVRFDSNQPIVSSPKTEAGERTIPIIPLLAQRLSERSGPLFPSASGNLCSEMAFKRAWDSYMTALSKAAGKQIKIRPHDLRHSYCTMLRDAGVDIKIAMMWMGHADKDMILKIYDHVTPSRISRSIASLSSFVDDEVVKTVVNKNTKG